MVTDRTRQITIEIPRVESLITRVLVTCGETEVMAERMNPDDNKDNRWLFAEVEYDSYERAHGAARRYVEKTEQQRLFMEQINA